MGDSQITLVPQPVTRADVAMAMVDVIDADRNLAAAIALNEAWSSGYIARLLADAEVIASQWLIHHPLDPGQCSADASVRRALDAANPRQALERCDTPIHDEAREALVDFLKAQARFHRTAETLERRGLRRTPLPA